MEQGDGPSVCGDKQGGNAMVVCKVWIRPSCKQCPQVAELPAECRPPYGCPAMLVCHVNRKILYESTDVRRMFRGPLQNVAAPKIHCLVIDLKKVMHGAPVALLNHSLKVIVHV